MQINSSSNASGNAINPFNQSAVPAIAKTYGAKPVMGHTSRKEPLTLMDKAGLLFVVIALLVLQFLGSIKLLK